MDMRESNVGAAFLKQKYNLHNTPEVAAATRRTKARTGERVSQDPAARIDNYFRRFSEITDRKNPEKHDRGITALKEVLHGKFVIFTGDIPETYWDNQKRLLRERGQGGDLEQVDWNAIKAQNAEAIITDQRSSLDNWVDYLASSDARYPMWLKYWTLRNVVTLAKYDKENKLFPKRSEGTTNPFPELNREALAYVLDVIEKKRTQKKIDLPNLDRNERTAFDALLQTESFPKLYAWAIEKVTPATIEQLTITEGKWVKYKQNADHMPLVTSLQGHGTGWCTAGESTAQTQLRGGDFYVYYSADQQKKSTIPRVAIRMEGNSIAEVRGVAAEQNLDPYIGGVVQKKLDEFPDGKVYEKKVSDMKMLTTIEQRTKNRDALTREDLVFLYEINGTIEGFGYQRDPRIEELRKTRNPQKDAPLVFGCTPDQIVFSTRDIRSNTKAYIGPLESGIFSKLPESVEHVYTSFPEGKIHRDVVIIGADSVQGPHKKLMQQNIKISSQAEELLKSTDFTVQRTLEQIDLVRLRVKDLGFSVFANTTELFDRANALGLDLCPAEVGPQYPLEIYRSISR